MEVEKNSRRTDKGGGGMEVVEKNTKAVVVGVVIPHCDVREGGGDHLGFGGCLEPLQNNGAMGKKRGQGGKRKKNSGA